MIKEEGIAFAEWVADTIFDDNWEYNKEAFAEIACRKLSKLGIVARMGDEWVLVDNEETLEQEPVLDKIRAEIETKYGQCDICEYFEDYDYEENDISEYRPIGNIADILQIIDKHRAESEG